MYVNLQLHTKLHTMKTATKIYSEKRKGITENVPLQMHIFFNGKRVSVFNTGFRCDVSQWDQEKQQIKRGTINKAGISAATINAKLKAMKGTVDVWAVEHPNGTIQELLTGLRKIADKKEKVVQVQTEGDTFFNLFDKFLRERKLSDNRRAHYLVLKRTLQRYEKYTGQPMSFEIDIHSFKDYIVTEHRINSGQKQRGQNRQWSMIKMLKSFFLWALKFGYSKNNPFDKIEIPGEVYGTPFYITVDERKHLYNFDFGRRKALGVQRDIFVFQCLVGCRVGDLMKLRSSNIVDGSLQYIAAKTKDNDPITVNVPLTKTANEIINRYAGGEKLLPFITEQNYNLAIKEMFLLSGLTRKVTVLNPITRKGEQRPLNEVATSHLARRAFIGNLYQRTQDPVVIGSMSGHVDGSKSFARYRKVDHEIQEKTVNLID